MLAPPVISSDLGLLAPPVLSSDLGILAPPVLVPRYARRASSPSDLGFLAPPVLCRLSVCSPRQFTLQILVCQYPVRILVP